MYTNESIVIIGARGGSKRIPHKNLQLLGGKPLIAWSIEIGKQLQIPVYVSTDSPEICSISKDWGAHVIERPAAFAQDKSTDLEWILHLLSEYYKEWSAYPSKLVFLRPTSPIRDLQIVKVGIDSFSTSFDSLRSLEPLKEAIQKTLAIQNDEVVPAYPFHEGMKMIYKTKDMTTLPNQVFPTSYMANGYVDILKPEYILSTEDLYGRAQAYITPNVVDIDTPEDLEYANFKMKDRYA